MMLANMTNTELPEEAKQFYAIKSCLCKMDDIARMKVEHIDKHPNGDGDNEDVVDDDQIDSIKDCAEIFKLNIGTKLKYLHYSVMRKELMEQEKEEAMLMRTIMCSEEGQAFLKKARTFRTPTGKTGYCACGSEEH